MADAPHEPSGIPALRYLAIMSAARDFGVSTAELEQVARRFDPCRTTANALGDALADALKPALTA